METTTTATTTSEHPDRFVRWGKTRYVCNAAGPYVFTAPITSEPHGAWWKKTEHGYVEVASNDKRLWAAISTKLDNVQAAS